MKTRALVTIRLSPWWSYVAPCGQFGMGYVGEEVKLAAGIVNALRQAKVGVADAGGGDHIHNETPGRLVLYSRAGSWYLSGVCVGVLEIDIGELAKALFNYAQVIAQMMPSIEGLPASLMAIGNPGEAVFEPGIWL